MNSSTLYKPRVLPRALKAVGAVGCVVVLAFSIFMISYYSANRPHSPQPERGWTVGLSWTYPTSYGTAQEENRLSWLSCCFVPIFCLMALAGAANIYGSDENSAMAARKEAAFPAETRMIAARR